MMLRVKKIPGGKLIKLEYELDDQTITSFRLYGDFFLHPEDTVELIEKALLRTPVHDVAQTIQNVLDAQHAQFIGVTPEDIQNLMEEEQ